MAPPPNSPHTEALETVVRLKRALAAHDIVLPSMDLDVLSYANHDDRQLVDLGRCNVRTALALIAALTSGRGRGRGEAAR
jgi:hypothetical protein